MTEMNMKKLGNLKTLIEQWATDRNLHMDYPVTRSSTVFYRHRVCGVGDTNL